MTEIVNRIIIMASLIASIPLSSVTAEPLTKPVDTKNTLILYISHLFMPAEGSSTLQNGTDDFSVNIIESNTIFDQYHFAEEGKQGIFDLETTALYVNYIRKIDALTEVKAVLPLFSHWGGFMDQYIESFHGVFPEGGLKNGGREYTQDDEIHFQYQAADGGPDINESFYGIGDPSFFMKRIIYDSNPGITCSAGIKLHTGHKAFINSNTTDFGIDLNADYSAGIFYFYGMAGCSYFYGDGIYKDELEQTRDYLLSSAIGSGIMLSGSLYFSIQFYIHSSLYDTGIEKIDSVTILNSYTVRWQINRTLLLQLCFDEDPVTYAGADVAFSMRCEYTF